MLNKSIIKTISACSAVTGAIIAIPAMIPFIRGIAFTALMFFVAPFIIVSFKKFKTVNIDTTEKYLAIGAITGITSFIGFAVIYFPVTFLLNLIFKIQAFIWVKVIFTNFTFLIATIILTASVNALFNAFSALITANMYHYIENKQ